MVEVASADRARARAPIALRSTAPHARRAGRAIAWLAIAIALAALVAWASLGGRSERAADVARAGSTDSAVEPIPAALVGSTDATPEERALAPAAAPDRRVALAPPIAPASPAAGVLVRCVRSSDASPVPHAEVFLLDGGPMTQAALMEAVATGADLRGAAAALGQRFVADQRGGVRIPDVPEDDDGWAVLAASPGWLGVLEPDDPKATEVEVVLSPTRSIDVRVVTASGEPAKGVLTTLRIVDEGRRKDTITARTGDDGRSTLETPPTLFEDAERQFLVAVVGLFRSPVEQELDFAAPADEPVELRLPDAGAVEVVLDPPSESNTVVRLHAAGLEPRERYLVLPLTGTTQGGIVTLGPVELGLAIEGEGHADGSDVPWLGTGAGPRAVGAPTTLRLVRGDTIDFSARLVDEEGRPVRGAVFVHPGPPQGDAEDAERALLVTPDGEGRVRWQWPPDAMGLAVTLRRGSGAREQVGSVSPEGLAYVQDLGDVVLRRLTLSITGRLVDAGGSPIQGTVSVERVSAEDEASEEWLTTEWWPYQYCVKRGERFEVVGLVAAGEALEAVATGRDFVKATRPVRAGDDVGDWSVERLAVIRGRIVADAHVPLDSLWVACRPNGDSSRDASLEGDGAFALRHQGSVTELVLDGTAWAGPPVSIWRGATPSMGIDLGDIDVRGALAVTTLDVIGADGMPIAHAELRWPEHPSPEENVGEPEFDTSYLGLETEEPPPAVVHASAGVDVEIRAPGHRPAALRLTGGARGIRLSRGIAIEVRVAGVEALGDDAMAAVWLMRSPGDVEAMGRVEDGVARLMVPTAGSWPVHFAGEGGYAEVARIDVRDIDELQVFDVVAPPELLVPREEDE